MYSLLTRYVKQYTSKRFQNQLNIPIKSIR